MGTRPCPNQSYYLLSNDKIVLHTSTDSRYQKIDQVAIFLVGISGVVWSAGVGHRVGGYRQENRNDESEMNDARSLEARFVEPGDEYTRRVYSRKPFIYSPRPRTASHEIGPRNSGLTSAINPTKTD